MKNKKRPIPPYASEGSFYTVKDGTKIFIHEYKPHENYSLTIFIMSGVTGINHNTEKDFIELLANNKNRVVVIHPRGTGYSEGKRGDISNFADFINDYVEIITKDHDYLTMAHKIVFYGQSMATAVALSVAEKIGKIDGVILVNPPYITKPAKGMSPSMGQYLKYAFYFLFAPHTPIVNMAGDPKEIQNEDDRKESESRINDPLLVKYFSIYYLSKARKMMDSMIRYAQKADYPLLLLYGMGDRVVDKMGCDKIVEAWRSKEKQYTLIEGGSHGKETVIKTKDTIYTWLDKLR